MKTPSACLRTPIALFSHIIHIRSVHRMLQGLGQLLLILWLSTVPANAIAQNEASSRVEASLDISASSERWNELGIHQFQSAQANGELSAEQLVRYYLQRIQALNRHGPNLHAVLELNPHALTQARQLDQERQSQGIRSPLHGVPVLLKANISTAGPLATHSGSAALAGFIAAEDAPLVQQLKAAGAIILGSSNLSEWSNFRGRPSSSGWSSLGGQTKNPYVLNRSPCGSSAGSGSAVSANLSMLAIGTETNGSIVCPAAINGIVGIKPTHSAVSGKGIVPIATSQDIAGPMARSVADAAAMLDILLTEAAKQRIGTALYPQALNSQLKGKRIGVVSYFAEDHPEVQAVIRKAAEQAAAAGAVIVDVPLWPLEEKVFTEFFYVLKYEFKRDLNAWLKANKAPNGHQNLGDIIEYNQQHAKQILAFYDQEYMLQAQSIDLAAEHTRWQAARASSRQQTRDLIDRTLEQYQLDAIALPTNSPAWLIDHLNGDRIGLSTSFAAANAGYPAITFPAGFIEELPIGINLVASAWQEAQLVSVAAAWEQLLQARQVPRYIPSLESLHDAPIQE